MQVVIEAQAVGAKRVIECALPRVAEGRMADVMHERKRFGEIFVEAKTPPAASSSCSIRARTP